jgi:hypothetical protein
MEKNTVQLIYKSGATYNLPVFLENTIDVMGVMVGFDGYVAMENHLCNFTYTGTTTGRTITIINTADVSSLHSIIEANFTVDWGDGNVDTSSLSLTGTTFNCFTPTGVTQQVLTKTSHTYTSNGVYEVSISLSSPWTSQVLKKTIKVPQDLSVVNPLGTFTGLTIPAYVNLTGQTQDYLYGVTNNQYTGATTGNTISFAALGKSRVDEFKRYEGGYSGLTITSGYTAYTIDNLTYHDYPDGLTHITGNTSNYLMESVIDKMITRNEHFIGFIDDPVVYSDIFIQRGQQSVLESTLRLCEIDNVGLLQIYGNGYFNIRKQ